MSEGFWNKTYARGRAPTMTGKGAIRVEGLDLAAKHLASLMASIPHVTLQGLIRAGLTIQREAQKQTPVDTGNLRASAFTVWHGGSTRGEKTTRQQLASSKRKKGIASSHEEQHYQTVEEVRSSLSRSPLRPEVAVGFTAAYALYVHENMAARHKVGNAKFLQNAILENIPKIQDALRDEVGRAAKEGIV